ncbi:MAG: DUF2202 domain-containing protein [Candidatus Lernaella stagnicola]|nr:DUF2202 domain-containing protein [Candidatus Lernaella stagnicola]
MFAKRILVTLSITAAIMLALMMVPQSSTAQGKPSLDQKTQDALAASINDEYKAQALYAKIMEKFGPQRPFANIIQGESRHIEMLKPLFTRYGVEVPADDWASKLEAPGTMLEACKEGVTAEKENVAMYDGFLSFVKENDIREVFTYLRDASQNNHLPAFERCVARGGEMGPGRGMGRGQKDGMGQGRGGGQGRGR